MLATPTGVETAPHTFIPQAGIQSMRPKVFTTLLGDNYPQLQRKYFPRFVRTASLIAYGHWLGDTVFRMRLFEKLLRRGASRAPIVAQIVDGDLRNRLQPLCPAVFSVAIGLYHRH